MSLKNINKLSENARFKVVAVNGIIAIVGLLLYAYSLKWTLGYNTKSFNQTFFLMLLVAPLMASVLLTIIFFILRPFQRYLNLVKNNEPVDDELYFKARRVSLNLTKVLIFSNIIGFFMGPNVGYFMSGKEISLATFLDHLKNVAICTSMGFVTGIFAVFVSNIVIAKDKLLLKMTHIHAERKEKDLKLRSKSLVLVLSVFLVSFVFTIFTGYHEHLRVKQFQSLLEKPTLSEEEKAAALEEIVYTRGDFMEFVVVYGIILFTLSLGMWFFYSKEQVGQLSVLRNKVHDILKGNKDLTTKLNLIYFDEVGEMAMLMNEFIENIRKMFQEIKTLFKEVESSGSVMQGNSKNSVRVMTEMSSSLKEVNGIVKRQANLVNESNEKLENIIDSFQGVAENVENQSKNMQTTSTIVEEVASNISSVTNSSTLADNLAKELNKAAQAGNQAVEDSVESITLVENLSIKVEEIITVITNIAEQTDMLAMNAAIEAAHAGDYGKGFAVVADEIRKLAEDSGTSAKEIITQIQEMGKSIKKSVDLSVVAGDSLGKIVDDVKQTSHLIREISFAMGEQNMATQNILNSTAELVESNNKIRKFTDQEKKANEEVITAMKELVGVTEEVLAIIQNQNNLSQQIIENAETVDQSLIKNEEAMANYTKLIEEFKL